MRLLALLAFLGFAKGADLFRACAMVRFLNLSVRHNASHKLVQEKATDCAIKAVRRCFCSNYVTSGANSSLQRMPAGTLT